MSEQFTISTSHFSSVSYRRYGEGPALMLLHGFPATGALWNKVIPELAAKNTVLIPDLPGTGNSKLDGEMTSMEELADGADAILKDAGFEQMILAGHSMGGYISLAYAEKFGSKLDGLSLVHSSAMADDDEKKEVRRKAITLIRKGGKEAFIKSSIPNLFANSFKKKRTDIVNHQISTSLVVPDASLIAFYNAMINRPDRRKVLSSAIFPVQWIIGNQDQVIPPAKSIQQSYLSSVNFVGIYEESGHMSMLEEPDRLIKDLNRFSDYCTFIFRKEGIVK